MKAQYECMDINCGYTWVDEPRSDPPTCLLCRDVMLRWLNYELWRATAEVAYPRLTRKGRAPV